MRIEVYRSRFSEKDNVPFGGLIPAEINDDYHDRITYNIHMYSYHVVFRLVMDDGDPEFESFEIYAEYEKPLEKAYIDLDYDEKRNLWYFKDKNDYFDTSGVFDVKIWNREKDMPEDDIYSVRLLVIPKLIELDLFQEMINDILEIHEMLIVQSDKSVGIGKYGEEYVAPGTPKWNNELWDNLKPELLHIMRIPPVLQKKVYKKTPYYKIRRYDSKVMKSYVSSGGYRANGAFYCDDNDIQENRIIKKILERFVRYIFSEYKQRKELLKELKVTDISNSISSDFSDFDKKEYSKIIETNNDRLSKIENELNNSSDIRNEITQLLEHPWFGSISNTNDTYIRYSSLFASNNHYRNIYILLNSAINHKHLLSGYYEANLFGVADAHVIYEYWVFYKLMKHFVNLNFVFDDIENENTSQALDELLKDYINKNNRLHGFTACMHRDVRLLDDEGEPSDNTATIKIMIGYNCTFGKENEKDKCLYPDFFIRVTREESYHWYFLDAKYNKFTVNDQNIHNVYLWDENHNQSVPVVCIDKYYKKIGSDNNKMIREFAEKHSEQHRSSWDSNITEHEIMGSYLIVADCDGYIVKDDLLCGYKIGNKELKELKKIDDNAYKGHQFGAIKLRPGLERELTTLIRMIFEYKEGCSKSYYTDVHKNGKFSEYRPELHVCWKSSYDHRSKEDSITVLSKDTSSGKSKFLVKCSCCGSARMQTFCQKCGFELIKPYEGYYHHAIVERIKEIWINKKDPNDCRYKYKGKEMPNIFCPNCYTKIENDEVYYF